MIDIPAPDHNDVITFASTIGTILERHYPCPEDAPIGGIPPAHVEAVSDYITLVVAEILQAWLGAGSEREVTLEELGPHVLDHVKGWSL